VLQVFDVLRGVDRLARRGVLCRPDGLALVGVLQGVSLATSCTDLSLKQRACTVQCPAVHKRFVVENSVHA
jgi:hypothetical protein